MQAQDPLAQLQDIHLAPPPGLWPLAIGWYLLIFLVIAFLFIIIRFAIQHYRSPKREAQRQLSALYAAYQRHGDAQQYVTLLSQLLRRAALSKFPRQQVASLSGADWLDFLNRTGKTQAFTQGEGRSLIDQVYKPAPAIDAPTLQKLSQQWLRRAL